MSTITEAQHLPGGPAGRHGALEDTHPNDWVYVKAALALGVIKVIEIALHVLKDDISRAVVVGGLLTLMVIKFAMIASIFMHLRYDHPLLSRVFYFGVIVAVAVFGITLTVFEYWTEDFFRFLRE